MKDDLNLSDILTDKYKEDDFIEISLSDRIVKYIFFFVSLILLIILASIFNLSILNNRLYSEKALSNITNLSLVMAPRGLIYDRFGKALTKNSPAFNAFIYPFYLPNNPEQKENVLKKISEILQIDFESLKGKVEKKKFYPRDRIVAKTDISHDEFLGLMSQNFEGVNILPSFRTDFTEEFKFSHILGYTSLVNEEDLRANPSLGINDIVGRTGLQEYYDSYLRGINGEKVFITDASGKIEGENIKQEIIKGKDLNTYIDAEFQIYFYNALKRNLENLGRNVGVGIALNPQNGEVLALFNIPSFDAKNISSYVKSDLKPLFNRAISGLYSPGSTIKPLVALGALAEGILNPDNQIFSPGYILLPNPYNPDSPSKFLDWQYQGWVDMYSAIAKSSDVYFYAVGGGYEKQKGLGINRLKKWWEKFLLDKKTGIDLPNESYGFLPDPEWKEENKKSIWRIGDTYNVSIGQGDLLVTPIALLNYISAISNGGTIYKPRIMKNIIDNKNNIIVESKPEVLYEFEDGVKKYIPLLQKAMEDTVSKPYGTAYLLHDLPIKVAGKTGSAQVEGNTKINAFFVGYAPAQNPQIALLLLIENAKEGSLNVVPVAKEVFLWYYENRLTKNH